MSFRALAAGIADKFADDVLLIRKGAATRDATGFQVDGGKPKTYRIRGRILRTRHFSGLNGSTIIRGFRLAVPLTCNFSEFCVGDKIEMLCGPYAGRCFTVPNDVSGGISGADYEIDVVEA